MMDLKQYWGFVRAEASKLAQSAPEGFVHITSDGDPLRGLVGGRVCEATPEIAARCIADRTHRLSTPEEIEAFKAERLKREQDLAERENKQRIKLFELGRGFAPPQPEPARTSARK